MRSTTSEKLVILEGPDCGGKSTLSSKFASEGFTRVHFGPMPKIGSGLARLYVEAMLPAALGHAPMVLDRCWMSEVPYGLAMRGGADRVGVGRRRILERLAMRCEAVVIRCLPPYEAARDAWASRRKARGAEYIDAEEKFRRVYDWYRDMAPSDSCLPVMTYDYTAQSLGRADARTLLGMCTRTTPHPLECSTAGNWDAPIVAVVPPRAELLEGDALYQWPAGSLGDRDDSWRGEALVDVTSEGHVLWVNSQDLLDPVHPDLARRVREAARVVAFGPDAAQVALNVGASASRVYRMGAAHSATHMREAFSGLGL